MRDISIVIVGVGGQGTLLASRILGALALKLGLDVKVSEVHGMAQRGGSVVTFVRMGKQIMSPLVEAGGADYLLAFELMEAARAVYYLKHGGVMLLNTQRIPPMPVVLGNAQYPEGLLDDLKGRCTMRFTDALTLAVEAGDARAVNLVLLGMLAAQMEVDQSLWIEAITDCVKPATLPANVRAFERGFLLTQ